MSRTRSSLSLAMGIAAVLAMPVSTATAQGGGAAFVNIRAVLAQAPGYAQAESTWVREVEGYRVEIGKMQDSLNTAVAKFEESSVMLSASNRATERKKLEDLEAGLRAREQELQAQAGQRRQELLDPVEERVVSIVEGVRAEGNYSMIFDVSSQASSIVAADKSRDITARVIERLKASGPAGND
ncbi:MAG: OmpH family outer membrane protein [Gemmatimonadales bacterium]|nr:OmpH family outer membrane protein [Gemmatimonadales bacterium]